MCAGGNNNSQPIVQSDPAVTAQRQLADQQAATARVQLSQSQDATSRTQQQIELSKSQMAQQAAQQQSMQDAQSNTNDITGADSFNLQALTAKNAPAIQANPQNAKLLASGLPLLDNMMTQSQNYNQTNSLTSGGNSKSAPTQTNKV